VYKSSTNSKKGILDHLREYPDAYLHELVAMVKLDYDINTSNAAISRCSKANNYSKKMIKRVAAQQNQELRVQWLNSISIYHPNQLLFVDESSCNEYTGNRRYGWAPKGMCIDYTPV
jgi:hypothetical protein